jgi:hypothetical protein
MATDRRRTIPLKALLQTKELSVGGILTQGAQLSRRQERVARQSRRRGAALLLGAWRRDADLSQQTFDLAQTFADFDDFLGRRVVKGVG